MVMREKSKIERKGKGKVKEERITRGNQRVMPLHMRGCSVSGGGEERG